MARPASSFENLAGRGARAILEGKAVHVGGPRLLEELGVHSPSSLREVTAGWADAAIEARSLGDGADDDDRVARPPHDAQGGEIPAQPHGDIGRGGAPDLDLLLSA